MSGRSDTISKATAQIIWDCPVCDRDNATYYRTGLLAGKAKCKDCGHVWNWSKKDDSATLSNDPTIQKKVKFMNRQEHKSLTAQDNKTLFSHTLDGSDDGNIVDKSTEAATRSTYLLKNTREKAIKDAIAKSHEKVNALKRMEAASSSKHSFSQGNENSDRLSSSLSLWPKKQLKPKNPRKRKNYVDDEDMDQIVSKKRNYVRDSDIHEDSDSEFEPNTNDSDDEEGEGYPTAKNRKAKKQQGSYYDSGSDEEEGDGQSKTKKGRDPESKAKIKAASTKKAQDRGFGSDTDDIFSDEEDIKLDTIRADEGYKKNKPRPTNAFSVYMLFNKEYRKKIAEENPGITLKELNEKLKEAYRNLTESEKERYQQTSDQQRKQMNEQRHIRPRNQKMPGNAYIQYVQFVTPEIQKEQPQITMKDRNAIISARWKALSEEEKDVYKEKSRVLKEKFIAENPEYVAASNVRKITKQKFTLKQKFASKQNLK